MIFYKKSLVFLFMIFCNNTFAQDSIAWLQVEIVFAKILKTDDFKLSTEQKAARIEEIEYQIELDLTAFQYDNFAYEIDDFSNTDYIEFIVKKFNKQHHPTDEKFGTKSLDRLEKIIDEILGKEYAKLKNEKVIEQEYATADNVLELMERFEGTGTLIRWEHISETNSDFPTKKSVRFFYDSLFDELSIWFAM